MKGADAGTRVGKRRLCWRWIAAGGLEGGIGQEAAAGGGGAEGGWARREMRDSGGVGADTRGCRRYHGYHHPRCEQALHVILA